MEIIANVTIRDRRSRDIFIQCDKRCIVRVDNDGTGEIYMTIQSSDDRTGVTYEVVGNVEEVYRRNRKTYFSFTQPPHDLIIDSDIADMFDFLNTLLLNFPKRKRGSSIEQPIFDTSLFGLLGLESLNLTLDKLTSIPREIDLLPKLKKLVLRTTMLHVCSDWSWMCGQNIGKTLEVLDLCFNNLHELPACMWRLSALTTLRLDNNRLSEIPAGIGMLRKLKILTLSYNFLEFLPGSFVLLSLNELDVAANMFKEEVPLLPAACFSSRCPSLLELAARAIVDHRLAIGEYDLPRTLQRFLEKVNFCACGNSVFDWCFVVYKEFDLNSITSEILVSDLTSERTFMKMNLCSRKCLGTYYLGEN